jgi:hypothetical protein
MDANRFDDSLRQFAASRRPILGLGLGSLLASVAAWPLVTDTDFIGNTSSTEAGAIHMFRGSLTFDGQSQIVNNSSPKVGGIYNAAATVTLNGAKVEGNFVRQCANVPNCPE